MTETRYRSILKAVSWRITASLITGSIVFVVTREALLAFSVGLIDTLIKLLAYYAHERAWMMIHFGRLRHPLEDLEVDPRITEEDKRIIRKKLQELGYLDK